MTKTVTIDGPAGSGKSTLAHLLAKQIDYFYLETGRIYRAITKQLLDRKITPNQNDEIKEALKSIRLDFEKDMRRDSQDEDELRSEKIDQAVVNFAKIPEIRSFCRTIQQDFAAKQNTIVEGRDIGTVVFPSAFCKFYIDARLDVRVKRRFDEIKKKNQKKKIEDVKREIILRDKMDRMRKNSPLLIPNDAVIIDVSNLSIAEALENIVRVFQKKIMRLDENKENSKSSFELAMNTLEESKPADKEVISATIISIDKDVVLDIGEKMDAIIQERETERIRNSELKVGDKIDVVQVGVVDRGILVSKYRADVIRRRKELDQKFKDKELVKGVVKNLLPEKGFHVSLQGVHAFCPLEEYDERNFNVKTQSGRRAVFEILSINPKQILVSRKNAIKRVQEQNLTKFYSEVSEGDIIEVKAISIKPHGVIVKVMDGVISILRNREISWERTEKKTEISVKVGDIFPVMVTKVEYDLKRIEISKRRAESDPFDAFINKHQVNDIIEGKVVHFEDFGAFIELVPGVEGLVLIHDLSWKRNLSHPKEILKKGQVVESVILRIDEQNRRIRLGIKQLLESPWSSIDTQHSIDSQVSASVIKVTAENIYCLIDDAVEAEIYFKNSYLHKQGLPVDFTKIVKEGDNIKGKILKINKKMRRVDLELKENVSDPWQDLKLNYSNGEPLKGEVTEVVEKGVNIKINNDVTGFCHVSQLDIEEPKNIEDAVKVGEEYSFIVQFLDEEKKKLTLSRKSFLENKDLTKGPKDTSAKNTITLSQFIKD